MTDIVSTEAAERLAKWCGTGLPTIATALRSLAAERDALKAENARLREALRGLDDALCRHGAQLTREERHQDRLRLIEARAALGEKK